MGIDGQDIIDDLVSTLFASNHHWSSWELEFIENLDGMEWRKLSEKQQEKALQLWEKL